MSILLTMATDPRCWCGHPKSKHVGGGEGPCRHRDKGDHFCTCGKFFAESQHVSQRSVAQGAALPGSFAFLDGDWRTRNKRAVTDGRKAS